VHIKHIRQDNKINQRGQKSDPVSSKGWVRRGWKHQGRGISKKVLEKRPLINAGKKRFSVVRTFGEKGGKQNSQGLAPEALGYSPG